MSLFSSLGKLVGAQLASPAVTLHSPAAPVNTNTNNAGPTGPPGDGSQGTDNSGGYDGGYSYGGYGGGWGGGGGGWGGGGGGGGYAQPDDKPTDVQKETAKNLEPIIHYNYDTIGKKFDLGDKVYDTQDQMAGNIQNFQIAQAERNMNADWYRQQQKLQSSMMNMRNEMGNAAYGTDFTNMYESFARADDQMDDDTLQAFRKNVDDIDVNYYDAVMGNIGSRNKLAADAEVSERELLADWAAQLNNIHPQLANGEYQSGVTGMGENRKEGDKPDDADDYEAIINRDNQTLDAPDWFKTDGFADERWTNALLPEYRDLIRNNLSAQVASLSGKRNTKTNTASSASRSGLQALIPGGYSSNRGNRWTQ